MSLEELGGVHQWPELSQEELNPRVISLIDRFNSAFLSTPAFKEELAVNYFARFRRLPGDIDKYPVIFSDSNRNYWSVRYSASGETDKYIESLRVTLSLKLPKEDGSIEEKRIKLNLSASRREFSNPGSKDYANVSYSTTSLSLERRKDEDTENTGAAIDNAENLLANFTSVFPPESSGK